MTYGLYGKPVPLREAVDRAIVEIEGAVEACREALDRACAMHIYAVGRCGGDCSARGEVEENLDGKFNDAMPEVAATLSCLLSHLDGVRANAVEKARLESRLRLLAESAHSPPARLPAPEAALDAAAEE